MDTVKIERKSTKMIAHRGLSSLEIENSHAAFIAAGNRSYYGIECDIHKTKDNVFVVVHDDDTKRIASLNLEIKKTTYSDLLNLNLYDVDKITAKPYLKIPTLEEYLKICIKYDKVCVIEFKNKFLKNDIFKVIEMIKQNNYLDKVVFISFHTQNLITIRNNYDDLTLQLLVSEYNDDILDTCINYKLDLDILYSAVTKSIVEELHQHNVLINVWTVNSPVVAEKLISYGVDFITTDILE